MDPDEFHRLLCRALHIPEDSSAYAILAQVEHINHYYLLNRPAEDARPIESLVPDEQLPPEGER